MLHLSLPFAEARPVLPRSAHLNDICDASSKQVALPPMREGLTSLSSAPRNEKKQERNDSLPSLSRCSEIGEVCFFAFQFTQKYLSDAVTKVWFCLQCYEM